MRQGSGDTIQDKDLIKEVKGFSYFWRIRLYLGYVNESLPQVMWLYGSVFQTHPSPAVACPHTLSLLHNHSSTAMATKTAPISAFLRSMLWWNPKGMYIFVGKLV
jgi:hypothetical protein